MSKSGFSCICNPLPLSSFWWFFFMLLCFSLLSVWMCVIIMSWSQAIWVGWLVCISGVNCYTYSWPGSKLAWIFILSSGCRRVEWVWFQSAEKKLTQPFVDKNTWWLPWACWYAWWASRVCGLLHLFKSCGGHWQTVSLIQEKLKAETKQPHVMTQTFKETYPSHERVWKLLGRVKAKSTSIYPVLGCRYAGACPSCYGVRGRVHPEQVATLSQGWCIQTDNQSRWHSHINTSQPHSLISRLFTYCLRGYTSTALVDYCIDDKKINFSWFI